MVVGQEVSTLAKFLSSHPCCADPLIRYLIHSSTSAIFLNYWDICPSSESIAHFRLHSQYPRDSLLLTTCLIVGKDHSICRNSLWNVYWYSVNTVDAVILFWFNACELWIAAFLIVEIFHDDSVCPHNVPLTVLRIRFSSFRLRCIYTCVPFAHIFKRARFCSNHGSDYN